jgi:hypothetical protein
MRSRWLIVRACGPFTGGERFHGQGVNLLAHSIAQGFVNPLVTPNAAGAIELVRHNSGKEMTAIALDLQVLANQTLGNVLLNFEGGGIRHGAHYPIAIGIARYCTCRVRW